jgi:hypothetical protein
LFHQAQAEGYAYAQVAKVLETSIFEEYQRVNYPPNSIDSKLPLVTLEEQNAKWF